MGDIAHQQPLGNIAARRYVEIQPQVRVLINHAEAFVAQAALLCGVELVEVILRVLIEEDRLAHARRIVEIQRLDHGGFATARLADDAQNFPLIEIETHAMRRHHAAAMRADISVGLGAGGFQAQRTATAMNLGEIVYFQNLAAHAATSVFVF